MEEQLKVKQLSNSTTLKDHLSTLRLPFQILCKDPWFILDSELCEESIDTLLPLSLLFEIKPDSFYSAVIQSILDTSSLTYLNMERYVLNIHDIESAVTLIIRCAKQLHGTDQCQAYQLGQRLIENYTSNVFRFNSLFLKALRRK